MESGEFEARTAFYFIDKCYYPRIGDVVNSFVRVSVRKVRGNA